MPGEVKEWLGERQPGWEVAHIYDFNLEGQLDVEILDWARGHGYLVITFDEDFPDGQPFPLPAHFGIIRLTGGNTTLEAAKEQLQWLFSEVDESELPGSLVIVGPSKIRVIPGPVPQPAP